VKEREMGATWAETVAARIAALEEKGKGLVSEIESLAGDVVAGVEKAAPIVQAAAPLVDALPGGTAIEALVSELVGRMGAAEQRLAGLEATAAQHASAITSLAAASVAPAPAPASSPFAPPAAASGTADATAGAPAAS